MGRKKIKDVRDQNFVMRINSDEQGRLRAAASLMKVGEAELIRVSVNAYVGRRFGKVFRERDEKGGADAQADG